MKARYVLTALAASFVATAAGATTVTPTDTQGWASDNVQGGGTVAITDTYKPAGQGGSLQFTTSDAGGKADFVDTWGLVAGRTLGNLSQLSYSFLRDSSSTSSAFLAPAFRLDYYDAPTGQTGYLIYEPVYNGYQSGVPTDQFTNIDMTGANFWMREFTPGVTIEDFNNTLADWASGTQQAPGADVLNANTYIYGIEVGVGSGWSGTFSGAADNVNIAFGQDVVSANFEPNAVAAVPETASWMMMILGFGAVGFAMRYGMRRSNTRFDTKIKRIAGAAA